MMNAKYPAEKASKMPRAKEALQGWKTTAIAAAIAVAMSYPAHDAHALALGRITVLSALGEPLRAEIELPEINEEEASSLRTTVAGPEAFRSAGLEYNAALNDVQIVQQRRPDGRTVLRVSSNRVVNDPFVDLILQVTWSSGRIVRDYTILLDPPALRQPAPAVAAVPQVAPAPAVTAPAVTAPARPPSAIPPPVAAAPAPVTPVRPAARAPAAPAAPTGGQGGQVVVKAGDTASKIAANTKPPSVSLDQMLVAMLRANPQAFVQGNVNRIKAGAVLDIPTAEQAAAVPAPEASQTIVAQSRDFNSFRSKLAGSVPAVQTGSADRNASGRVQAQVDDSKPSTAAPDKLTLSKGGVQAKANEDRIAREKAAKDASDRVAELSKNISDLNKLGTPGAAPAAAPAPAPAPSPAPVVNVPGSAVTAAATPPAPAPAAPEAAAPAPAAAPATPPAPAPAPAKPAPVAAKADESSWIDGLLENPLVPAAAAALVALLAGFGIYRSRQRKKAGATESSYLESRLQPDSFFGASGGQRVDTADADEPASSMSYSPSQLDAAGDVDPVAEADVYLAYGRDLQAEEILKEALRINPTRPAIHLKLAEIYAKRRDVKGFQASAAQVQELTDGAGPEWVRITELGRDLDPANPMWSGNAGAAVSTPAAAPASMAPAFAAAGVAGAAAVAAMDHAAPAPDVGMQTGPLQYDTPYDTKPMSAMSGADSKLDLDLDLDLGLDTPATPASVAPAFEPAPVPAAEPPVPVAPMLADNFDFGEEEPITERGDVLAEDELIPTLPESEPIAPPPTADALDFDIDIGHQLAAATPPPPAKPPAETDSGLMEFDLGSLTLDLGDSTAGGHAAPATEPSGEDPLATKLALAEEFNAIGDADGARALAEEVLAEASGPLKSQAQRFLAELA